MQSRLARNDIKLCTPFQSRGWLGWSRIAAGLAGRLGARETVFQPNSVSRPPQSNRQPGLDSSDPSHPLGWLLAPLAIAEVMIKAVPACHRFAQSLATSAARLKLGIRSLPNALTSSQEANPLLRRWCDLFTSVKLISVSVLRHSRNTPNMLRTLTVFSWICLSIGLATDSACAVVFPYGAYVKTNAASVRSGPGAEFYATDRLEHGSRVEVYRHDDRWAAIRPPDGSFSWIPANAVKLTDTEPLGTVTTADVKTRIGTRYGDEHNVEFVPLRVGEIIEILGEKWLEDSSQSWYKILPCAGEFRWVRLSSLAPITDEVVMGASQDQGVRLAQDIQNVPASSDPDRFGYQRR